MGLYTELYTMEEVESYKCNKCGKIYKDKGICSCIVREFCTHQEIINYGRYSPFYKCDTCGFDGQNSRHSIDRERKKRLEVSGGAEMVFHKHGDSYRLGEAPNKE